MLYEIFHLEDVEYLVAEGGVDRVRTTLLVPEQGLQQSGELVDVQRIVPEIRSITFV